MKKKIIIFSLSALAAAILFLRAAPPPTPEEELLDSYGKQPPLVKNIWVQKLATPTEGRTMIMRIEYENNVELPETLKLHYAEGEEEGNGYVTFYDDGSGPDATPHDHIFAAYLSEDPVAFSAQMETMEGNLAAAGKFIHFTGHSGEMVTSDKMPKFDATAFSDFTLTKIDPRLVEALWRCDILKQNSLFITDLSVVEDEGRTFNVVSGTGTPMGDWTFGHMIKNIANQPLTGIAPKEMLKRWLRGWVSGRTFADGRTVLSRPVVIEFCIAPWMKRAKPSLVLSSITAANWETTWNGISEDSLLKYAPFRLMAIVNRLDLRANFSYSKLSSLLGNQTGETRFIFTLIAPINLTPTPATTAGLPPQGRDGAGVGGSCLNLIDWQGMNVILEYVNPLTDRCQVKNFAQQWADLSTMALGSPAYKNALAAIVHQVTDANAAPSRRNGTALNQMRTNERIFANSPCGLVGAADWRRSDWELSQFEIDKSSGYLVPAFVSNTPVNSSNLASNLTEPLYPAGTRSYLTPGDPAGGMNALLEWVFWKKVSVNKGVHNLPQMFVYGGDTLRLATTARIDAEQVHYWDFNWDNSGTSHYTTITAADPAAHYYEKDMRQQLSLNTCQGCHAGENKTVFTQMHPLGYGQAARYWLSSPDEKMGSIDIRFSNTYGMSSVNGSAESTYPLSSSVRRYPIVSAFLTGRTRKTPASGSGFTWQDDWVNSADDADDASMEGLYYVYDPTDMNDGGDGSRPKPDRVVGYNDLEMRKQQLCRILNKPCVFTTGFSTAIAIIDDVIHAPFSND